ncbi:hypothetical protein HRE53_27455 (plasmid) [Acaryochloris sp. 'Moss Beach']|uniref:hypothetical protein n=1 Tax=Acaryochloris sp. 'Moss Beach' TaxID=2740837 RepID=UPI001F405056|nr:hypothetical protein [Acaryochloris sp. 'Moss Beach']UJB72331.1 hypothetical protein HRE53_27455 [Acaryochloris sp. 'Moss Beach']
MEKLPTITLEILTIISPVRSIAQLVYLLDLLQYSFHDVLLTQFMTRSDMIF